MTRFPILAALLAASLFPACGGSNALPSNAAAPSPTPSTTTPGTTSTPATITSISVAGSVPALDATAAFTATAHYSDGSTKDVTTIAAWTSSNTAVATVGSGGAVTLEAIGVCQIAASYQGTSGTFTIVAAS